MADSAELIEGVDPAFHPRLKIFLGADIIGSTAYKQPLDIKRDDPHEHAQWAGIMRGFYKTLNDKFLEHWQDAFNRLVQLEGDQVGTLLGPEPRFWKTIGDEVLFWKELTHSFQIWLTLACWLKAVESVRGYFEGQSDETAKRLDIKSTVWMAGFPVRNKAILGVESTPTPEKDVVDELRRFYKDRDDSVVADFIGPGIDVGFRISRFASARKMSIGLDVAYTLAVTHMDVSKLVDKLSLETHRFFPERNGLTGADFIGRLAVHYSGSERLEGVLGGMSYPKFWISTVRGGSLEDRKVALYTQGRGHGQTVDWDSLELFCDKFYEDRAQYVSRPFVIGDKFLGEYPDRYEEFLRAAAGVDEESSDDFQI